ncbi:hypothetical protein RYH73_01360 [Olivibacter sp. CPCC 100613]
MHSVTNMMKENQKFTQGWIWIGLISSVALMVLSLSASSQTDQLG